MQRMMGLIKKGPDVAAAAQTGDPSLVDPEVVSATSVVSKEARGAAGMPEGGGSGGNNKVGVEILNGQTGSDLPPASDTTVPGGTPFAKTTSSNPSVPTPANTPDPNELKPTAPVDPNELKPADTGSDQPLPPPTQVNEIQQQGQSTSATTAESTPASDEELSSSKKHKKKGLKKINPF
jgi:hypothetical protein